MNSPDQNNLNLCLAQAANPLDDEVNEKAISQLVHLMKDNKETIGFVLRFFGHKIQSPHELEALKAISVIQTLVKRSDKKFVEEVGKFRFLNELIKVISPKYLAHRSPETVKKKIIELLYLWSIELKHESKIFEAYQMLKRQGIITSDPTHLFPEMKPMSPPPPRPKDEIWDNAENALMLKRLIQSGQPDDRIAANKLIKMLAHQADKKTEIKSRCKTELELARNNGRLLSEVLANFTSPKDETFTEKELLDELYESCKKLRPKLFKLAGELQETDSLFEEILGVNDELTKIITEYDIKMNIVTSKTSNSHTNASQNSENLLTLDNSPLKISSSNYSSLLSTSITSGDNNNLVDISSPTTNGSSSNQVTPTVASLTSTSSNSIAINGCHIGDVSLLSDHETIKDNVSSTTPIPTSSGNMSNIFEMFPKTTEAQDKANAHTDYLKDIMIHCTNSNSLNSTSSIAEFPPSSSAPSNELLNHLHQIKSPKRSLTCLDELENMMRITLNAGPKPDNSGDSNISLNALRTMINNTNSDKQSASSQSVSIINSTTESTISEMDLLSNEPETLGSTPAASSSSHSTSTSTSSPLSLTDIFIPLESVEPSDRPSIILVNEKEIKSILNFGSNQPHPNLSVAVLTTTNLSNKNINKIFFNVIPPQSSEMKFKYQAPSSTNLTPSSPFLPPSAITQVIIFVKLIPSKSEECQFRLQYSIGTDNFIKSGKFYL